MHARSDERPRRLPTPTQVNTSANVMASLLPRPVKSIVMNLKTTPATAPSSIAPKISIKGVAIDENENPSEPEMGTVQIEREDVVFMLETTAAAYRLVSAATIRSNRRTVTPAFFAVFSTSSQP